MGKRVAVLTDSNSGITQAQGKALGIRVLPMPFYINDELFYEDITLSQEQFYHHLETDAEIHTSMPVVGDVLDCWDSLLKEYDEIVYIPMSSGLSGSCAASTVLAQEMGGRIQVADNHRISVTMRQSVQRAVKLARQGLSALEIKQKLEEEGPLSSVYLTVETLAYFSKTGRVTPTTAALGDILNIKPVLMTKGEKFETCAKVHGLIKAKNTMIRAVEKDREHLFADYPDEEIYIGVATSCLNQEDADKWLAMVQNAFPGITVYYNPLSLSISCHTGPNALGVGISLKP